MGFTGTVWKYNSEVKGAGLEVVINVNAVKTFRERLLVSKGNNLRNSHPCVLSRGREKCLFAQPLGKQFFL